MVEYTSNPSVPGKAYFRCDRMRATLSTASCADMWRRSNDLNDGSHAACKCCPLGAVHAGEVAASMSPLKGTLTCARCHRTATRLIGHMHCVSCYNRQREVMRGRNAKGTAPVKAGGLVPRRLRFDASGDLRMLRMDRSLDMDELMVATLRDSRKRVFFAMSAPTMLLRQWRLW